MPGPPIWRYKPTLPNLLPVDRVTGGRANMAGWYEASPADNTRGPGYITVAAGESILSSTISPVAGGGFVYSDPIPVTPELPYLAAVTTPPGYNGPPRTVLTEDPAHPGLYLEPDRGLTEDPDHPGLYLMSPGALSESPAGGGLYLSTAAVDPAAELQILWISADGSLVGDAVTGPDRTGRLRVSGTAPAGAVGAVVVVTATNQPILVSQPVFVQSTADPGPVPPQSVVPLMGDRLYRSLPAVYRTTDMRDTSTAAGRPLYQFLQAIGEQADWPLYIADRIASGALTDPALADDGWLPWLTQATGVQVRTNEVETRAVIASKLTADQPGTPAAVLALARTWLTGTRVCDLVPSATPWTLIFRVRADEMGGLSTTELAQKLIDSGALPAGFTVIVETGGATWDAVDADGGSTWDAKDSRWDQWRDPDSVGVTGV